MNRPALATQSIDLFLGTVDNIIALAYVMLQRHSRSRRSREAMIVQSAISRRQVQW